MTSFKECQHLLSESCHGMGFSLQISCRFSWNNGAGMKSAIFWNSDDSEYKLLHIYTMLLEWISVGHQHASNFTSSVRSDQKHGCKSVLEIQAICHEQLGVLSELKDTPSSNHLLGYLSIKLLDKTSIFLVEPPTTLQHECHDRQHAKWNLQQLTNMFNDPSRRNHHTGLGLWGAVGFSRFSSGDALSISHWFVIHDLSMGILKWIGFTFILVDTMPNMPWCFAFSVLIIAIKSFNLPTQEEYGRIFNYESLACCQHAGSIERWASVMLMLHSSRNRTKSSHSKCTWMCPVWWHQKRGSWMQPT